MVCPNCGRSNEPDAQFCANPECRAYLPAGADRPADGPARPVEQRTGARLQLAQTALTTKPGEAVTTTVTVHNGGNLVDQFTFAVTGPMAGWASVEPREVSVYPGTPASATVRFAPPAYPPAPAGVAPFAVHATSELTPGLVAEATGTVTVEPVYAVDAELTPQTVRGGGVTRQTLVVENRGNVAEEIRLGGSDAEAELQVELPPELVVQPGRSGTEVRVRARQALLGKPRNVPFRITVQPSGNRPELVLPGMRIVTPRFRVWHLAGFVVVLVGVIALATLLVGQLGSGGGGSAGGSGPPPTADPNAVLVQMTRAGGIAGEVVEVTVYGDGRAQVTRSRGSGGDVQLTEDELATLRGNLAQLELGESGTPRGADLYEYTLVLNGRSVRNYTLDLPPSWLPVVAQLEEVIARSQFQ